MSTKSAPVLVIGATGKQGGATAAALLAAGVAVRALVRDPSSDRAEAVAARGAELVRGDLDDRDCLVRAARGARAVFSVQMPALTADGFDFDGEVTQGVNLIEAAKAAGVPQFVHTSVAGAGLKAPIPGPGQGHWETLERTMAAKAAIQDRLRAANFPHWTILKPGTFMENFLPSAGYLFPRGRSGGLVSVVRPQTRLSLIAVADIGVAAAAAITEPRRFHRVELELAGDHLSMTRIAEILSDVAGIHLPAPDLTVDEALAAGMPAMGIGLDRLNVTGQPGRPRFARDLGIPVTGFEEWARRHRRHFAG